METTLKEIPILCINLPRATERRDYIEKPSNNFIEWDGIIK